jgi:hypothetical protein
MSPSVELVYLWPPTGQCMGCGERVYREPTPPSPTQPRRLRNVATSLAHSCQLDWQRLSKGDVVVASGVPCRVLTRDTDGRNHLVRTYA